MGNDVIEGKSTAFTVVGFLVMVVGAGGAALTTYSAYVHDKLNYLVISSIGYLVVGAFIAQVIVAQNSKKEN